MKKLLLFLSFVLFSQLVMAQYCTPSYIAAGYAGSVGSLGQMGRFQCNGYAGYTINDTMMRTVYNTTEYLDETRTATDTIPLQQGASYTGVITYMEAAGYVGNQIWIDFNNDYTFQTTEEVTVVFPNYWVPNTSPITSSAFTMSVPMSATPGYYRMRVRNVWYCYTYCEYAAAGTYHSSYTAASTHISPCIDSDATVNEYYTGNTVDYTVYIHDSCSLGVAASNSGPICSGGTLSLTGSITSGSAVSYSWSGPGGFTSTLENPTITGVTAAGNYVFTATSTSYCSSSAGTMVTVYPALTATVTGTTSLCSGNAGTMTINGTPGATIYYNIDGGSTLNVLLNSAGTASFSTGTLTTGTTPTTHTYSFTSASIGGGACTASLGLSITLTVYPMPTAISGPTTVCAGISFSYTDGVPGGTWTSSNTSVATIVSGSGVANTVAVGSTTISYTAGGGCYAMVTTNVLSSPSPISATVTNECPGVSTTFTDPSGAGNWTSSNSSIATVGATSGVVGGVSSGTAYITFSQSSGCYSTYPIVINPVPGTIGGTLSACEGGGTSALSNALTGGSWASSNTSIATVDATTGIVTGITAGSVTISYTVTGCPTSTTFNVLALPPSIITPVGDTMLCPGDAIMLTANTGRGYTYQWNNAGGPITSATREYYETSSADYYSVTITDTHGCVNTSTPMDVTVNPVTATISTSAPTIFCAGSGATLNAGTGVGYTYQWMIGGAGIAGATDASYVATETGYYNVAVSNAAGCSDNSSYLSITAIAAPSDTVSVAGPTSFCPGASVTLTALGSAVGYQWANGGTAIAGATNNTFVATTSGDYQVTLTNAYPCSSTSANITLTQLPTPSAAITPAGSTTFCSGGSVVLTLPTSTTYQWYFDGAAIAGATHSSYTASAGGYYEGRVTSAAGCANTTSPALYVDEVTVPAVVPLTATNFCWGGGAYLGVNVIPAPGVTYQWLLNGTVISGATNPNYNATISGNFACVVSVGTGCTGSTANVTVTQFPLPDPIITYSGGVLSTGNFYTSYQWFRNLLAITGANSYRITPTLTGEYTVRVIDTNGCQSVSSVYNLTALHTAGIAPITNANDISIYPNPAQNNITIVASQPVNVVISSMDGRKIMQQENATEMNVSQLASGIYMVVVTAKDGQILKIEKLQKD